MLQSQITIYDLAYVFVVLILVMATAMAYIAGRVDERKVWINKAKARARKRNRRNRR